VSRGSKKEKIDSSIEKNNKNLLVKEENHPTFAPSKKQKDKLFFIY